MSTKILLADDSITIQKVIGIIFGGEEYALTIVDNGKAALERALEVIPDVMLIDALMPGMSGYEVCQRLRETPELANKPILLLTGSFEPFDETKARECGADDFVAKPFESQQIINKVAELCARSASRVAEQVQSIPQPPTLSAEPAQVFQEPEVPPFEPPQESILPSNTIWDAFSEQVEPLAEVPPPLALEEAQPAVTFQEPEELASPWVPIDEQSFQVEEETAADILPASYGEPAPEAEFSVVAPAFAPVSPLVAEPAISAGAPAQSEPAAAPLTEEQLKAAIADMSRDVIERVVWEVVPDLAESMIREAIRRIREGVQES